MHRHCILFNKHPLLKTPYLQLWRSLEAIVMLMHEHDCLLDNEKHIVETISHSVIRRGFKFLRNFSKKEGSEFSLKQGKGW